jgi:hypothetical protein
MSKQLPKADILLAFPASNLGAGSRTSAVGVELVHSDGKALRANFSTALYNLGVLYQTLGRTNYAVSAFTTSWRWSRRTPGRSCRTATGDARPASPYRQAVR